MRTIFYVFFRKIYMYVLSLFRVRVSGIVLCGNKNYGGWNIIPNLLSTDGGIVYSFGIGEDLSFSETMIKKYHSKVFAFDPTPKAINFVKRSDIYRDKNFRFFEYGLSEKSGKQQFHLPQNDTYVSGSVVKYNGVQDNTIDVEMKSLKDIMYEQKHNYIDILKMDIEGSEFEVINNLDVLDCGQVCIEVHDRFFGVGIIKLIRLIRKMKKLKYVIFNISENQEEISFVLKSMIKNRC